MQCLMLELFFRIESIFILEIWAFPRLDQCRMLNVKLEEFFALNQTNQHHLQSIFCLIFGIIAGIVSKFKP